MNEYISKWVYYTGGGKFYDRNKNTTILRHFWNVYMFKSIEVIY
jgi:hypothetical protein